MIEVCTTPKEKTENETPFSKCHMVASRDDGSLDVGISDGQTRFDVKMKPEAALLFAASLFRALPSVSREDFYNFVFPKLTGKLSEA
jgi:hypothetical protein